VDRLKPLEVFRDIPCAICGEPMSNNDWTREGIVKIFKEALKAHPACWKTPTGQAILATGFLRTLHNTFGHREGS